MFRFLKNRSQDKSMIRMADLNGNPLNEGDLVISLRYELGKCRILGTEEGYVYESLETGQKVSWSKMIDARTELQKVKKLG